MRLRRRSSAVVGLATVLALAAAGCDSPTGPAADLAAARQRWADRKPAAYTIVVAHSCFCFDSVSGPAFVTVRGGAVESRVYVGSGGPVSARFADAFPTVDGLFAVIDAAERGKAASVRVTYDRTYGYPVELYIDYDAQAADDEQGYSVAGFQVR